MFFLCRNFAMAKSSNQRFLPQNGEKSPEFQRFLWPQLLENLKVFTYDERSYTKVAVLFALHHTVALNCYRLFGEFRKQRQWVSIKGGFFSESAIRFSNIPISKIEIFQKTILSLKFEFVVYCYWREI